MRNALLNMCVAFAINGCICLVWGLYGCIVVRCDRFYEALLTWAFIVFVELFAMGVIIVFYDANNKQSEP